MIKKIVKTKNPNVVTYIRPSVKAIKASRYEKQDQRLFVYPCIEGWLELRRDNKDGVKTAEFIRKEDVTFTLNYLLSSFMEYLKTVRRKMKYRKIMPETL